MGGVLPKTASVSDILRDVRRTKKNATARGPSFEEDVDRFLGEALTRADDVDALLAEARDELETARANLRREDAEANDLVARIRDDRYNDIGRTANDRRMGQWFPGGSGRYTEVSPSRKPASLVFLATMFVTIPHPMVSEETSTTQQTALREKAARLEVLLDQRADLEAQVRLLGGQRTANARFAAMQLANLKRYWIASGMSQHDVHMLIPDRPGAKARTKAAEAGQSTETGTAETEAQGAVDETAASAAVAASAVPLVEVVPALHAVEDDDLDLYLDEDGEDGEDGEDDQDDGDVDLDEVDVDEDEAAAK